jgi:manganese/zinc/iron transport system permease protein
VTPLLGSFLGLSLRADDLWVIATGSVCAAACGVLGCFLLLRRLALLGDAVSHAVLPGLALAFIVTGTRDVLPMLAGALVAALLTAALSEVLPRVVKVGSDAAMGIVFSGLFALGVILIEYGGRNVDLDPGCVLYGLIELVPFDTVRVAGLEMPRAFATLAVIGLIDLVLVVVFYKELKLAAFDPQLAGAMGFNAALIHYGLITAIAGTVVASFEAVGSILVITMLIAPGATAQLLTDRMSRMLVIAALVGVASAVGGYWLSVAFNTSTAGMMSVAAGAIFGVALIVSPRHGVVARVARRVPLALRIEREDVLGHLFRERESGRLAPAADLGSSRVGGVTAPLLRRWAVGSLRREGLIRWEPGEGAYALTAVGTERARDLVRGHRLWESYLAQRVGLPSDHVHEPSHAAEHYITPEMREEIRRQVAEGTDPHGRAIP